MKRVGKWLIHAVAYCTDCDFEETDYRKAQKLARDHAKKTGHEITVETGYVQIYNDHESGKK